MIVASQWGRGLIVTVPALWISPASVLFVMAKNNWQVRRGEAGRRRKSYHDCLDSQSRFWFAMMWFSVPLFIVGLALFVIGR
jgi:hypothetical protein